MSLTHTQVQARPSRVPVWLQLPESPTAGFATLRDLGMVFVRHAQDGARSILPGAQHRLFSLGLLCFWMTALLGDAVTTSLAMRSGIAYEGNPIARTMFGAVGMEVWMTAGVFVMLFFAFLTLKKPTHVVLYPVVFTLPFLLFVKLYITGNNLAVLWIGGAS